VNGSIAPIQQRFIPVGRRARTVLALWGAASIALGVAVTTGAPGWQITGGVLGTAYVLVLSWWLLREKPRAADLPAIAPVVRFFSTFRPMLWFVILLTAGITALTCFLFRDGWLMLLLSILLALLIIIIGRKRIRRRHLIVMLGVLITLGVVEQLLGEAQSSGLVIPMGASLMFLAGALLLEHTKLARVRLLDGDYRAAGKSFLWGCLLAVPPALLNLLTTQLTPPSQFDRLFDRWWEPFYALQPGILEEIWARLLLVTLVYALLRPASGDRPQRALLGAAAIAAFIHGAAHFPGSISSAWEGLFIALMYGIPLVLLFLKRDLEQAVAYHFFIDFVRFAAFVYWNTML
jgi:hypothetical protein